MRLDCPHCGVSGSAKDSYTGQKVKCPKCKGVFEVIELRAAEETTPAIVQEETLEWEDIASEVDLQQAGNEIENEQEEDHGGEPAELSPWQDEYEKPAGDNDFHEEDVDTEDEFIEKIPDIKEDDPEEIKENDLIEESSLSDPEDSESLGWEIEIESAETDSVSENYENIPDDELQSLQKEILDDDIPFEDERNAVDPGLLDSEANEFTISGTIREAWKKTKGAKGVIWAGSAVMYLVLLIIVAGGKWLVSSVASTPANLTQVIGSVSFLTVASVFSILFTAGLLLMGMRKVAGETIHWKMIFKGFSCAGRIIAATILQFILVAIGMLLILPGIYLAVGYAMTVPLIVDKGLSPWQAMEMSRKAVHKIWWRVMGIFCLMLLIFMVSFIPIGIGLIWTWPMSLMVVGVMYKHLFEDKNKIG
jgi:hypothetical protein